MAKRHIVAGAIVFALLIANADKEGQPHTTPPPPETAPSSVTQQAISQALDQRNKSYVWGDEGPDTFDCSGLMQWSFGHAGMTLPRTSREQYHAGTHVPVREAQPGDLLFWANNPSNPRTIRHVALYIGNSEIVEATGSAGKVRVRPVSFTEDDIVPQATRPQDSAQ